MIVRAIEIFRAGTHSPTVGDSVSITASDVANIAAGYDPLRASAPLTLGHPLDDQPRLGCVLSLAAENGRLFALAKVADSLVEFVRSGRYRNVSASFHKPNSPHNPTPGSYALKHVGFLGAAAPAVRGLQSLCFASRVASSLEFYEFAAPPAHGIDAARHVIYQAATELHLACPSLSFIECARRAERALL